MVGLVGTPYTAGGTGSRARAARPATDSGGSAIKNLGGAFKGFILLCLGRYNLKVCTCRFTYYKKDDDDDDDEDEIREH